MILFIAILLTFGCLYLADTCFGFLMLLGTDLPNRMGFRLLGMLLFLLLAPLLPGVLSYAYDLYRAAHGEISGRVPATEIFHCYASLRSLLRATCDTVLHMILFFLPMSVVVLFFSLLERMTDTAARTVSALGITIPLRPVFFLFGGIAALLFFIGAMYLTVTLSPALFLSVARPELSFFACLRYSFLFMRPYAGEAVFALFRFGLLSVLSLFCMGIPFFIYLLPHGIFSYISMAQEISNTITIS